MGQAHKGARKKVLAVVRAGAQEASPKTVLAVDIGNTVTRFGLFDAGALCATWSVTTPDRMTADEAHLAIAGFLTMMSHRVEEPDTASVKHPRDAIISCVVPDMTDAWVAALHASCGRRPLVVGPGLKTGIKMRYDDPSEVGSDRIADLVCAKATYGAPLVVVDLGTTTNFEIVDQDGTFAGGLIAPGLALSAKALAQAAARLPVIEIKAPATIIGKNTREAMQAGIVMGEAARIDGLVDLVWGELGYETGIVVTGADAGAIAALLRHEATSDDTLTLRGLHLLYEMNRKKY